ncbi:DUF5937 family protein [Dactylosporangium sp. NPDC050688]|uniref:DUF5937 family protein n=1 Tax=Dactylosporangium sp. NPDC050688 TaxID=3157217 RepID=UPI0033EF42F8
MTLTIDITGMPAQRCGSAPSPLAEPARHPAARAWAAATAALGVDLLAALR